MFRSIHIPPLARRALTEVVVKINGKQVALVKGVKRLKKPITLTKLPSGTYKISILATTVLKQRLSGSQTYKSCAAGSGKIGLKGGKKASPPRLTFSPPSRLADPGTSSRRRSRVFLPRLATARRRSRVFVPSINPRVIVTEDSGVHFDRRDPLQRGRSK